ncbi:MAG: M20/M25/M40 family metallo-hydrolase [Actinomycetota bacterium]
MDVDATALLQELLRFDSTNPPGNELPVAELLARRLGGAGLETEIFNSPEGRPSLVATLEGPAERPALVLLSHTDVVGVETEQWSHDPFGGAIDQGFIWGRGALDMKGIAAMHAATAMTLAGSGTTPQREVIVVVVADEEAGGAQGAEWLVSEHPEVVGFAEGRPAPDVLGEGGFGLTGVIDSPILPIVAGEKSALWLRFEATGDPGHGSMPPRHNAVENTARFLNKVTGFSPPRVHPVMREQLRRLAAATSGTQGRALRALASGAGPVVARAVAGRLRDAGTLGALLSDTVTPTQLEAGYKGNVVPGRATGSLDCRLLPDRDPQEFIAGLNRRGQKYGVTVSAGGVHASPVSRIEGPTYAVLEELSARLARDAVVVPSLTPGTTDVRVFRRHGAHGYGWVPLIISPELLATVHGHDERIPESGFLTAVELMTAAVARLAG